MGWLMGILGRLPRSG